MGSCARATCGRGKLSLGLMARHGKSIAKQSEGRAGEKCLPVGGRVKKLRVVGDQSSPPSREQMEERWSLDARSGSFGKMWSLDRNILKLAYLRRGREDDSVAWVLAE